MKKVHVVKWDSSLGPQPLLQYPPEKAFLDNETLLKVWASHEVQNNPVIIQEIDSVHLLSYKEELKSGTHFVVLTSGAEIEEGFEEIVAGMANSLLKLIDTPHFVAALQEMFKTIVEYGSLTEDQLLASLFQDRVKNAIFEEIRHGVITKTNLLEVLNKKYGISTINLDLLLTSFIRLGILVEENLYNESCLFLKKDFFIARLPPDYIRDQEVLGAEREDFLRAVRDFFSRHEDPTPRGPINQLLYHLKGASYDLLLQLEGSPLSKQEALDHLKGDGDLYSVLLDKKLIAEIGGRVFLLAGIKFLPFAPTYIIGELRKQYLSGHVPVEVLLRQVEILDEL